MKHIISLALLSIFLLGCTSTYQGPKSDSSASSPQQNKELEVQDGFPPEPKLPKDKTKSRHLKDMTEFEEEREGYLEIIGDLRWDKLTSKKEWISRFPECLSDGKVNNSIYNEFPLDNENGIQRRYCSNFLINGIPLSPVRVYFSPSPGQPLKSTTSSVAFEIASRDQSLKQAFKKSIKGKYPKRIDGSYCSKYTCWKNINKSGSINAIPSPYTTSILKKKLHGSISI